MDKPINENTTDSEAIQIVSLSKSDKNDGWDAQASLGLFLFALTVAVLIFAGIGVKEVFFKPHSDKVVASNSDVDDDYRERPRAEPVAPQYDSSSGDVSNTMMITLAKDAVKANMSDPGSAKFDNITVSHKVGNPVVCGFVNGKNKFGGYVGSQRFISNGLPELTFLQNDHSNFSDLWNEICLS